MCHASVFSGLWETLFPELGECLDNQGDSHIVRRREAHRSPNVPGAARIADCRLPVEWRNRIRTQRTSITVSASTRPVFFIPPE